MQNVGIVRNFQDKVEKTVNNQNEKNKKKQKSRPTRKPVIILHCSDSDFIWPFLWPYMGVIPNGLYFSNFIYFSTYFPNFNKTISQM